MVSSRTIAARASSGSDTASIVLKGRYEIAYEPLSENSAQRAPLPMVCTICVTRTGPLSH
jgi:hypothetical protein